MVTRSEIVSVAKSYIGVKQGSKKHKELVDIFNSKHPHGEHGTYTCAWCDIFWTAVSIKAGATNKETPMSYNCGTTVEDAIRMGLWVENDNYLPKPGDGIIYNWNDSGKGDCKTGASHIGMIVSVSGNTIKVIEGNYSTKQNVSYRTIYRNQRYIRGFVTPKYNEKPEKLSKTAHKLSHPKGTKKKVYKYPTGKATSKFTKALKANFKDRSKWGDAPKVGASCDVAVATILRESGICSKYPRGLDQQFTFKSKNLKDHKKENVTPYSIIKKLDKNGTFVVLYKISNDHGHTLIYDRGEILEASYEKAYLHVNTSLAKIKTKRPLVIVREVV